MKGQRSRAKVCISIALAQFLHFVMTSTSSNDKRTLIKNNTFFKNTNNTHFQIFMTFNTNLDQTCKTDKIFLLDQRMK